MKDLHMVSARSQTTVSICSVVLIASTLIGSHVQAQDTRPTSSGNTQTRGQSVVSGRVVFDDSGQGVSKVSVNLVPSRRVEGSMTAPMLAITNEQGEFRFNGVAAGDYNVLAQVDPRISGAQSYSGSLTSAMTAKPEEVSQSSKKISVDGRTNLQVELRVANPHFGVISGYVMTPGGDVAAHARVACSSTTNDGARTFTLSATTDDKGSFRIERVPPGEYILRADPPPKPQNSDAAAMPLQMPTLNPTFYPSTVDAASAVPVNVAPDNETAGINISLIERSVHRISGTIRMRGSGEPVSNVMVQLISKPPSNASSATGDVAVLSRFPRVPQLQRTGEKGNWSFSEIPDGEYTLRVNPRQAPPPTNSSLQSTAGNSRATFVEKRQDLTVAGSDMTDITIELSPGARISGSMVVEGDKALPPRIAIMAGVNDGKQPPASATVQTDGSFTLIGVPEGEVSLVPQLRPANTFYVKAIEANGLDLTRQRLKVEDESEIKNVRIIISPAVAILIGHVLSAQGKTPLSRIAVFLVPVDPTKHLADSKFTTMTGVDGSFLIGAAPGDYVVVTLKPGERPPLESATLPDALKITLQPNERRSLEILR